MIIENLLTYKNFVKKDHQKNFIINWTYRQQNRYNKKIFPSQLKCSKILPAYRSIKSIIVYKNTIKPERNTSVIVYFLD